MGRITYIFDNLFFMIQNCIILHRIMGLYCNVGNHIIVVLG